MTTPRPRRLFFALWPSEALRIRLAEVQQTLSPCRGRPAPVPGLHITLVFLGNVASDHVPCIERLGETIHGKRFSMQLDHVGYFRRAGVVWLGPAEVPEALHDLYRQLSAAVAGCGLTPEDRRFCPHLTLFRKVRRHPAIPPGVPLSWPVENFVLVESKLTDEGSRYEVIGQWPLHPDRD